MTLSIGTPYNKFSPGYIASLKSGGPKMTVTQVRGCLIDCIWWQESLSSYQSGTFESDSLNVQTVY